MMAEVFARTTRETLAAVIVKPQMRLEALQGGWLLDLGVMKS